MLIVNNKRSSSSMQCILGIRLIMAYNGLICRKTQLSQLKSHSQWYLVLNIKMVKCSSYGQFY